MTGRIGAERPGAPRLRLWSPTTATIVGIATIVASCATIPLGILIHQASISDTSSTVTYLVLNTAFAGVGLIVARREPGNPIGWLLLGTAVGVTIGSIAPVYAYLDYRLHHGTLPLGEVAVALNQAYVYGFMMLPLTVLLFPDGRAGRRWRWPLRAYFAVAAVYVAGTLEVGVVALGRRSPLDASGNLVGANHPYGPAAWFGPVQAGITIFFGVFCIASVVSAVFSFSRASAERRQQLKWLGAGGATAVVLLLATILWSSGPAVVGNFLLPVALTALPVSIGVGILRYRLYEIDRLISRTLAYALLTGLLSARS